MGSGWVAVGRVEASEIDGSNPVIGKFIRYQLYWKDKNKEKEARNGPNFLKMFYNMYHR